MSVWKKSQKTQVLQKTTSNYLLLLQLFTIDYSLKDRTLQYPFGLWLEMADCNEGQSVGYEDKLTAAHRASWPMNIMDIAWTAFIHCIAYYFPDSVEGRETNPQEHVIRLCAQDQDWVDFQGSCANIAPWKSPREHSRQRDSNPCLPSLAQSWSSPAGASAHSALRVAYEFEHSLP